jgi:hypothetical protein
MRLLIMLCLMVFSFPAMACVNPAATAGEIIMSSTNNVPQYCDGTNWIAMTSGRAVSPSTLTQVVPSGLIAHWRMEDISGTTVLDSSGNGNHGTLNVATLPAVSATGVVKRGFHLTTADQTRIQSETGFPTGANPVYSMSVWMQIDPGYNDESSIFYVGWNAPQILFRPDGGMTYLRHGYGANISDDYDFNFGVERGRWILFTAISDGVTTKFYKNLTLEHTTTLNAYNITTSQFGIGNRGPGYNNIAAVFDEFRLYNRAITEAELREIYEARDGIRFNGSQKTMEYFDGNRHVSMTRKWPEVTDGLVGHWKFDEISGTTAIDSSGNGHNGTYAVDASLLTAPGAIGRACKGLNAGDYSFKVTVPDHDDFDLAPNEILSFSLWYKGAADNTGGTILQKRTTVPWEGYQVLREYGNNRHQFRHFENGNNHFNPNIEPLNFDQWTHVACVMNSVTDIVECFQNGVPEGTQTLTDGVSNAGNLMLCGSTQQTDDVRFYNRGLTLAEIQRLYAMGAPVGQSAALPQGCAAIGDICDDGTVYVGLSPDGNVPMFTTQSDLPGDLTWKGNTSGIGYVQTSITNNNTGASNTQALLLIDSDSNAALFQPHSAAQSCADLVQGGADDWYLPARAELALIGANMNLFPGINQSQWYWSSTEDAGNMNLAWTWNMGAGNLANRAKNFQFPVRCVRKGPAPRCANPYGMEGQLLFNDAHDVVQYCDGARWIAIGNQ